MTNNAHSIEIDREAEEVVLTTEDGDKLSMTSIYVRGDEPQPGIAFLTQHATAPDEWVYVTFEQFQEMVNVYNSISNNRKIKLTIE